MKKEVPPSPPKALPIVTFSTDVTLHLNGEDIHVLHVGPAHTDGDAVIVFPKSNVIHMGDCFITAGYPLVDISSGGRYDGFIDVADKLIGMSTDTTKFIPGHGDLGSRTDLKTWHDMLQAIRERVKKQADAGKSLAEIQAMKLTAQWDEKMGKGFIKPDMLVEFVFRGLKSKP
jgi:glyoxylase-like metal-dependent hydrolase (beta-lactamase superfamily II)